MMIFFIGHVTLHTRGGEFCVSQKLKFEKSIGSISIQSLKTILKRFRNKQLKIKYEKIKKLRDREKTPKVMEVKSKEKDLFLSSRFVLEITQ